MKKSVHRDPTSAWQFLLIHGGIELRGRDEGLEAAIHQRLNPASRSFKLALLEATMESFARAFFESIEPYVAMFRDILQFFQKAEATLGQGQWVLSVGDLDLDLEHFRQHLARWSNVAAPALWIPAIDSQAAGTVLQTLVAAARVEGKLQQPYCEDLSLLAPDVRAWVMEFASDRYAPMPKRLMSSLLPVGLKECALIGSTRLQRLLDTGLTPSRAIAISRKNLRRLYCGNARPSDPSDAFNFWTIVQDEDNGWLRSFVTALGMVERLPKSVQESVGMDIKAILNSYSVRTCNIQVSIEDLESVLSLPIWRKRYELFSVWIAT